MGEGMKEAKDTTQEKTETSGAVKSSQVPRLTPVSQATIFNLSRDPRWAWFLIQRRPQASSLQTLLSR